MSAKLYKYFLLFYHFRLMPRKSLWDGLDLYIENSPLFGIPKIQTPLLIMHNDNDGAVPYYQGIEMFIGMRRLQKPVWMIVYNTEGQNLKKTKNRKRAEFWL